MEEGIWGVSACKEVIITPITPSKYGIIARTLLSDISVGSNSAVWSVMFSGAAFGTDISGVPH